MSTGNFHTAALSLAFETLGLAIAQCAAASAARFIQLTGSGRNGLPKYLSPVGGALGRLRAVAEDGDIGPRRHPSQSQSGDA